MTQIESNRPLRILQKVLDGGLGAGNIGVVVARHGVGKLAVLTCITLDHAMQGRKTLHVAVGKSIDEVRAYDDEVLSEMIERLGIADRPSTLTSVERNKQIYTFADGRFSPDRLRHTLEFLKEHAEFEPEMIEIQGWPRFRDLGEDEMRSLKQVARDHACEVWLTAHRHRDDECDQHGVPVQVMRFADDISVIMTLEPEGNTVPIRFVKVREGLPPEGINLEFDPKSMLIRWH